MKFTANKKDILNSLTKISGILDTGKEGMTSSFKLYCNNNKLSIYATDFENSAKSGIDIEMDDPGDVLINGKRLIDICNKVKSENIIFDLKDETIFIKGDAKKSAKYQIACKIDDSFPEIGDCENYQKIDGNILKTMIEKTIHAAGKEDTRYVYNGLFLNSKDGKFSVTGTDGRRLSTITTETESDIQDCILHHGFLKELLKNISEEMFIGKVENEIYIKSGNTELVSRLIDGKFPDYEKIIPKEGTEIEVNKSSLLDSLDQIMVMTGAPSFQIVMSGNTIKTNIPDIGNSEVEIDFQCPIEIGLNGMYLIDALKSIDSEKLVMSFGGAASPVVMRADNDFICLIMPMKI